MSQSFEVRMISSNDVKEIIAANPPRITISEAGQASDHGSLQISPPLDKNRPGRKPKHLTFTRDRVSSEGDIRDLLKRKREVTKELDSSEGDPDSVIPPPKKMINGKDAGSDMSIAQGNKDNEVSINRILASLTNEIKLLRAEAVTNTKNLESRISTAQSDNIHAINGIKEELKYIESTWDSRWKELKTKQEELEGELATIKANLNTQSATNTNPRVNSPSLDTNLLESKIRKIDQIIDLQEKEAKRLNIIIKNHNWTQDNLRSQAQNFLRSSFDTDTDVSGVQAADKLGRVIRVKLSSLEAKEKILSNKAKILKDSKISISRDLTHQELIQRSNLRKAAEEKNK